VPLTAEQIARDIRKSLIGDAEQVFTFQGSDYSGRITPLGMTRPLEVGGFQEEPTLSLLVALITAEGNRTFGTRPAVGDRVTVQGKDYRILSINTDNLGAFMSIDLTSVHK
jgi:hypothetical protein